MAVGIICRKRDTHTWACVSNTTTCQPEAPPGRCTLCAQTRLLLLNSWNREQKESRCAAAEAAHQPQAVHTM